MRIVLLLALAGCSGPQAPAPMPQTSATSSQTSECTAAVPADRSSCSRYLQQCSYPSEPRCPMARCADVASQYVWLTTYNHCAVACPAAMPAAGAPCDPVSTQVCAYKGGDKCGFRVHCSASGWVSEEITLCGGM